MKYVIVYYDSALKTFENIYFTTENDKNLYEQAIDFPTNVYDYQFNPHSFKTLRQQCAIRFPIINIIPAN